MRVPIVHASGDVEQYGAVLPRNRITDQRKGERSSAPHRIRPLTHFLPSRPPFPFPVPLPPNALLIELEEKKARGEFIFFLSLHATIS